MKRNLQGLHDCERMNTQKLNKNEASMTTVVSLLTEIKTDMKRHVFHLNMDKSDMSDFFPLETNQDLNRFLDRCSRIISTNFF